MKPPLAEAWERAAVKELADIQQILVHGGFFDYEELIDRLESAIENIRQMQQIEWDESQVQSSRPEINALQVPKVFNLTDYIEECLRSEEASDSRTE